MIKELERNGYTNEYIFLDNIKEDDVIRTAGDEYYYILFADENTKITVNEFIFTENEEYYREIYKADNVSSIILCGNASDIIPNLKITATDSKGNTFDYIPFISLKDGSVSTDNNGMVIDYTLYHKLLY